MKVFPIHEPSVIVDANNGTFSVHISLTVKGVLGMGRSRGQRSRDKNKASLPQVPKNMKSDGNDVEFSQEMADQADLEAQARANAANQRVNHRKR